MRGREGRARVKGGMGSKRESREGGGVGGEGGKRGEGKVCRGG